jgi:hypothetical protein
LPHAVAKATEAAAPEATEATTAASTRCMAGTPTYGYACGKLAQRVPNGEPMLDMRRREFITLLGGAAAWPLAARAQQRERVRRVGMLTNLAADDPLATARVAAFAQAMQGLGWIVGRNLQIGCTPQYCTLSLSGHSHTEASELAVRIVPTARAVLS